MNSQRETYSSFEEFWENANRRITDFNEKQARMIWQAATEQGVGEPVGFLHELDMTDGDPSILPESHLSETDDIKSVFGNERLEFAAGFGVYPAVTPLYTNPPKPTGGGVPEGLIEFAKRMLAASRDGCGVDGSDIHDWALECGLIEPYRATEPCGADCVCAEVAGFPIECYQDSALLATQQPPEQDTPE